MTNNELRFFRKLKKDSKLKVKNKLEIHNDFCSNSFDPFGSYTGVCEDIHEKPVQDADDL